MTGLRRRGDALVRAGKTYAVLGAGGGQAYAAWLDPPAPARPFVLDAARYTAARAGVARYWRRAGSRRAPPSTCPRRAVDGRRAGARSSRTSSSSWRYSIGNPYEEFSFPESLDGAQVMAELGFGAVGAAIVRVSLTRRPTPYPGWTMGEKLLAAADVRPALRRPPLPRRA